MPAKKAAPSRSRPKNIEISSTHSARPSGEVSRKLGTIRMPVPAFSASASRASSGWVRKSAKSASGWSASRVSRSVGEPISRTAPASIRCRSRGELTKSVSLWPTQALSTPRVARAGSSVVEVVATVRRAEPRNRAPRRGRRRRRAAPPQPVAQGLRLALPGRPHRDLGESAVVGHPVELRPSAARS